MSVRSLVIGAGMAIEPSPEVELVEGDERRIRQPAEENA